MAFEPQNMRYFNDVPLIISAIAHLIVNTPFYDEFRLQKIG